MQLYIIGNGFDRYHDLDTRYVAFAYYLQEHHYDLYENLIKYFGLPEVYEDEPNETDSLWSDFENTLANLDSETILDDNTDYLPNEASDDFRSGDVHAMAQVMERIVKEMTDELFLAFKEFILNVRFPPTIGGKRLYLNKDALYLTFNYTDTLERYYNIPSCQILHIHGSATEATDTLVLGHGISPENFREKPPTPPASLNEEELHEWHDQQNDNYNYSYESAKDTLAEYFSRSYKQTEEIIGENEPFFNKLDGVFLITILGHSLSDVDWPYLKAVYGTVNKKASWSASYYGVTQRNERVQTLLELGVQRGKISVFRIESIKDNIKTRMILKTKYFLAKIRSK